MKRWLVITVKLGIAVGLLTYLVSAGKLDIGAIHVRAGGWHWAGLSLAAIVLALLSIIFRWQLLLRGLGIAFPFRQALKLQMIGCLFYNFGLGNAGGDIAQVLLAQKHSNGKRMETAVSVLANRLIGMMALLPIAVVGLGLNAPKLAQNLAIDPIMTAASAAVLILVALVGGWIFLHRYASLSPGAFLYHPTLATIAAQLKEALGLLTSQRRYPTAAFGVALATHVFNVAAFYFMSRALPTEPVGFGVLLFVVPIGYLAAILPIAPAGVGVGQVAFGFLIALTTSSQPELGANLFTAYQVVTSLVNLSGLYFFFRLRRQKKVPDQAAKESSGTIAHSDDSSGCLSKPLGTTK